jgi:hypothetical protein
MGSEFGFLLGLGSGFNMELTLLRSVPLWTKTMICTLKIPAHMSICEHLDSCRFTISLFHNNLILTTMLSNSNNLWKKPQSVRSSSWVRLVVQIQLCINQLLQLLLMTHMGPQILWNLIYCPFSNTCFLFQSKSWPFSIHG